MAVARLVYGTSMAVLTSMLGVVGGASGGWVQQEGAKVVHESSVCPAGLLMVRSSSSRDLALSAARKAVRVRSASCAKTTSQTFPFS